MFFLGIGCSNKVPHFNDISIAQGVLKTTTKKEKLLIKRFSEYWHAREQGNMRKAWEYELPYQKYLITYQKYINMVGPYKSMKTKLLSVQYKTPYEAIITREVQLNGSKENFVKKDKWIFVKDTWYHKFYQTIFPPKDEEEAEFQ